MKSITSYEDLHCWKLAVELCETVYYACEKAGLPTDDELGCRWYVAALNVSGKIAFAYGPEDTDWFLQRMPAAKKYTGETLFWALIAHEKGYISKTEYTKIKRLTKRIAKKIDAIIRYLKVYNKQEQYQRQVFFKDVGKE